MTHGSILANAGSPLSILQRDNPQRGVLRAASRGGEAFVRDRARFGIRSAPPHQLEKPAAVLVMVRGGQLSQLARCILCT